MAEWRALVSIADVFHDDDRTLLEKATVIAERMKVVAPTDEDERQEFDLMFEELVDAAREDDVRWFDNVWDAVYDWADAERVWIWTIG